jgi:hypothetical protein
MDVAIAAGKIAEVAARIDPARANRVADATGLYVVPGRATRIGSGIRTMRQIRKTIPDGLPKGV